MSKKWFSGPPPSVGWWPASGSGWDEPIRWWDGLNWSRAALPEFSAKKAAARARRPSPFANDKIQWQHRPESWPERSKT